MPKVLQLIVFASLASAALGIDKTSPSERDMQVLVGQLVSPNQEPVQNLDDVIKPQGFDEAAQKQIYSAISQLLKIGPPAFPYLVERFTEGNFDSRYCVSDDDGPSDINFSVGTVCRRIVSRQLQPYGHFTVGDDDPRTRPRRPDYITGHRFSEPKSFARWWKTHKEKSLLELQKEVLEWTVAEEERRPADYSADEREQLTKLLTELRRTGKVIPPGWPFAR